MAKACRAAVFGPIFWALVARAAGAAAGTCPAAVVDVVPTARSLLSVASHLTTKPKTTLSPVSGGRTWYLAPASAGASGSGQTRTSPFTRAADAVASAAPGDTIVVLPGEYRNANYGKKDIWKDEDTLRIWNLRGAPGRYITVRAETPGSVIVRCDSQVALHVRNSAYVRIYGFTIIGEVENIPLQEALDNQFIYKDGSQIKQRVPRGASLEEIARMKLPAPINAFRPPYFDTKGILVFNSQFVELVGNNVSYMPGTGLRIQGGDYITARQNIVHDCSRRSSSGTHGFVIHSAENTDGKDGVHFLVEGNTVFDNYNEIYSWSELKDFITPHIDEGKGITVQKTSNSWNNGRGRMLFMNNVCYGNGFSGLHINDGAHVDIYHNTLYGNLRAGQGVNLGISLSPCVDCRVENNIIVAESAWGGYALQSTVQNSAARNVFERNLVVGRVDPSLASSSATVVADAGFVNAASLDLHLRAESPARNVGLPGLSARDFDGRLRDTTPDLGAFEFA